MCNAKTAAKAQRVETANRVIAAIAAQGRRLFYSAETNNTARFKIGNQGQILLIDDFTGWEVYVASQGDWTGFNHGDTAREIIEALRDYIRTGQPIPSRLFDDKVRERLEYSDAEMALVCQAIFSLPGLVAQAEAA